MRKKTSIVLAALLAGAFAAAAASPAALVICAPGYPSNTTEAQPSMDALATAVARTVGWPASRVSATYYATEDAGVDRLKAGDPAFALVPLPFFLRHERALRLVARAQAVPKGGTANATWTLVAGKGRVTSPSSLSGFTIVGLAAYAPAFVRNVALAPWGKLPSDVAFEASGQVLSALRRAASGEKVAVLLDGDQASSMATLPFAKDLETVATSPALPAVVLCSAGGPGRSADAKALVAGLLKMADTPEGKAALDAVRLVRFVPLDATALAAAEAAYGGGGTASAK